MGTLCYVIQCYRHTHRPTRTHHARTEEAEEVAENCQTTYIEQLKYIWYYIYVLMWRERARVDNKNIAQNENTVVAVLLLPLVHETKNAAAASILIMLCSTATEEKCEKKRK